MPLTREAKTINKKQNDKKEARLRRLKIEEENLIKSINANLSKIVEQDDLTRLSNLTLDEDLQKYKHSLEAIQNLFLDIKENTNDNKVKSKDIDEIKQDVLQLETCINELRDSLRNEIRSLKEEEDQINKETSTNNRDIESDNHTTEKIRPFNQIIPSQVKNMMNCPFKCLEVQQYQEFIKSDKKFGGWNEYYHNVFVKIWNKHFGDIKIIYYDDTDIIVSPMFSKFSKNVLSKITGITLDDLKEHSKWYIKYLYYKNRQQQAINKYKEQKRLKNHPNLIESHIKVVRSKAREKSRPTSVGSTHSDWDRSERNDLPKISTGSSSDYAKTSEGLDCDRFSSDSESRKSIVSYMERMSLATEQWNNRYEEYNPSKIFMKFNDITNIPKLQVPKWRSSLNT